MKKSQKTIADYTHFGVGNQVKEILEVKISANLIEAVQRLRIAKEKFVIIAGGSNVFFPDTKLDKTVIIFKQDRYLPESFTVNESGEIECDGSVLLEHLVMFANAHGLAGIEMLTGIPGTVGGAIVGSAGAYGQWIADSVVAVQVLDEENQVRWLTKKQCRFGHKDSIFKHEDLILLRARFKLPLGNKKELEKHTRLVGQTRTDKFGHILNCCAGSYFKNVLVKDVPKKAWAKLDKEKITGVGKNREIPAGYLLDLVGARGLQMGKAQVTDFHANLIVNTGGAKAKDILDLATELKKRVKKEFGVELEEEVRYMV